MDNSRISPEKRIELLNMFNDGKKYGDIALIYQIPRNTVASIIYKMRRVIGVPKVIRKKPEPQIRKPRKIAVQEKPKPAKIYPLVPYFENKKYKVLSTASGIYLLDAGVDQCRWPLDFSKVGHPRCCGDKIHSGSYCQDHFNLVYMKSRSS